MPKRHSGVHHINSLVTHGIWPDTSCQPCLFSPLLQGVFAGVLYTLCKSYSWKTFRQMAVVGDSYEDNLSLSKYETIWWGLLRILPCAPPRLLPEQSVLQPQLTRFQSVDFSMNGLDSSGSFWTYIAANVFSCPHDQKWSRGFLLQANNRFFFSLTQRQRRKQCFIFLPLCLKSSAVCTR